MKIKSIFFRSKSQQQVDVVETWEVRWQSRYGGFSGDTSSEVMVFTSEADALSFKAALTDAFKLIKHTSGTSVSVSKA